MKEVKDYNRRHMAHTVRLSDEAYEILTDIAEEEGRTLPKQIEYLAKRLAANRKKTYEDDPEYKYLTSKEAYEEACRQADAGETIHVGEYKGMDDLLEKLGI
ncbi:MAG: ribbon-helix-helix domain-containing protein [Christensenellaceae bacterium]|jgi:hypothetical protein|nr:ribbon-helix-helix domain-containing protein [Christensenellaceae bacterium]